MGRGDRGHKAPPVSVALSMPERSAFETEARRRGLGLSTTIRTLAFERASQVQEERQRERARRWQSERLRRLIERIDQEGFQESTQAQVDDIFAQARGGARLRRAQAAARR